MIIIDIIFMLSLKWMRSVSQFCIYIFTMAFSYLFVFLLKINLCLIDQNKKYKYL
jgi:hypothetical protein